MIYECCCEDITFDKWKVLMHGARKCSYKRLISKIKREIPSLYEQLMLDVPNPYAEQYRHPLYNCSFNDRVFYKKIGGFQNFI